MTDSSAAGEYSFLPDFCRGHSVLVVVLVAELMAIVLSLMGVYYHPFSLAELAMNSFFMQWVGLSSATLLCGLRRYINRLSLGLAAVAVVALVALVTLVLSLFAQALRNWLDGVGLPVGLINEAVLGNVLIAAILTGMTMRYFYVQEELMRRRESELKARIQALQSRIRPHFLFNSMNTLASLISVSPATAEQVVEDLSELFRASLRESDEQVTLAQELALCRHYVHIEQLRLGERLQVEWLVDDSLLDQPIPLLLLQPLLENAIYHGIQPRPEGGKVTVKVVRDGSKVLLEITNPVAATQTRHQGNRMAQENVRNRLAAIHGAAGLLEVFQSPEQYRVLASYPYNNTDKG